MVLLVKGGGWLVDGSSTVAVAVVKMSGNCCVAEFVMSTCLAHLVSNRHVRRSTLLRLITTYSLVRQDDSSAAMARLLEDVFLSGTRGRRHEGAATFHLPSAVFTAANLIAGPWRQCERLRRVDVRRLPLEGHDEVKRTCSRGSFCFCQRGHDSITLPSSSASSRSKSLHRCVIGSLFATSI